MRKKRKEPKLFLFSVNFLILFWLLSEFYFFKKRTRNMWRTLYVIFFFTRWYWLKRRSRKNILRMASLRATAKHTSNEHNSCIPAFRSAHLCVVCKRQHLVKAWASFCIFYVHIFMYIQKHQYCMQPRTHTVPYQYRSFPAKKTYNKSLFGGNRLAT